MQDDSNNLLFISCGLIVAVPNADPIRKSYSIDPCVFKDDDGKIYCYFGGIWGGQLQWYKDNKALKNEHLPEGKEAPLPSRVAMMTDDV